MSQLIYESNPKHSDRWQIGKRGSLCEDHQSEEEAAGAPTGMAAWLQVNGCRHDGGFVD
jgi:hypothetical protein